MYLHKQKKTLYRCRATLRKHLKLYEFICEKKAPLGLPGDFQININ